MTRETWSSKVECFLSILGYGMGVGTLWKFPYLCMRNGGGAFLIPFLLFTFIGAIPCVFLEFTIGQFSQRGVIEVWNLCPPFKGLGLGAVITSLYFASYAVVIMSWFLFYVYHSFSTNVPWVSCDNDWNTPTCTDSTVNSSLANVTRMAFSQGIDSSSNNNTNHSYIVGLTAAEEFWRYKVLNLSDGLTEIGSIQGHTVLCLAIMYICIFLCLFQGIKVSGKVVYVTVGLPYILVTVFLVRGCLLPGAAEGIWYYIFPDFNKLLNPKIWVEALGHALFNLGIAMGCLVTMSSHNKFNNNCFIDAISITLLDVFSTIYAGFAFFSIMGHVAHLRGVTVEAFQSSGFNLGFIVYPQAVASLPLPQLWSSLAFLLLLFLGIDSIVPAFEVIITPIMEQFPILCHRRWLVSAVVLVPSFIIGLFYTTQGGMYVLTLVEWYATFPSLLLFTLLECIVVNWIYGTDKLSEDMVTMWGKPMSNITKLCLKFICPILMTTLFGYALYAYRPPKYDTYIYPSWATGIGWSIAFSSILPIPVIFLATVWRTEGDTWKQKLQLALKPNSKWGPRYREKNSSNDVKLELLTAT